MNTIKVNIDKEKEHISVYNNGEGIPIEIYEEEDVYVPEMLFGQFMTSSNYNDDEKQITGGRNGLGVKLTNIFSTKFTIETTDIDQEKKYVQTFYNNMTEIGTPQITAYYEQVEYTTILFKPDFEKFCMSGLTDDVIALLSKHVHDVAGTVEGVKVFLNNKHIQVKSFEEYV